MAGVKPPSEWSPDQAKRVAQWLRVPDHASDPKFAILSQSLDEYFSASDFKAGLDDPTGFNPGLDGNPEKWDDSDREKARAWLKANPNDLRADKIQGALEWDDEHHGKPSQARIAMQRPGEFHPPTEPSGPGGFLASLPNYLGGGTEHFLEPSPKAYERAKPSLPPGTSYGDFKNMAYAQAYDRAQAEGRPIVRQSATTGAGKVASDAALGLGGAVDRAFHVASFGLDEPLLAGTARLLGGEERANEELARYREMKDRLPPEVATPADLAGALNPYSPATKLAGALGGAIGLGKIGSIGGAITGGLGGAALGAAGKTAENFNTNTADELAGHQGTVPLTEGVPLAAGLGGGLGMLGGTVQGAANTLREGPLAADLAHIERAGGKTTVLGGLKLPAAVKGSLDEAEASGRNAVDLAAAKVRGEFAEAAAERSAKQQQAFTSKRDAYFDSPEGQTPVSSAPLVKAMVKNLAGSTYEATGERLPLGSSEFGHALSEAATFKPIVFKGDPREVAEVAARNGAIDAIELGNARKAGIHVEVPQILEEAAPEGSILVLVQPKPVTARDVDALTHLIDSAANVASKTGRKDAGYNRLTAAVREVRDQFAPNEHAPDGLSALYTGASEARSKLHKTLEDIGVKPIPTRINAEHLEKQMGTSIRKYKSTEGRLDADLALEDLAQDVPQGLEKLSTTIATRAAPKVMGNAPVLKNVQITGGMPNFGPALTALQMRADALSRIPLTLNRAELPLVSGGGLDATLERLKQLDQENQHR